MGGWRDDDLADVCHRSVVVVFVSCRGISWNLTTVFPVPHSWTSRRGLTLSQRGREQRLGWGWCFSAYTHIYVPINDHLHAAKSRWPIRNNGGLCITSSGVEDIQTEIKRLLGHHHDHNWSGCVWHVDVLW